MMVKHRSSKQVSMLDQGRTDAEVVIIGGGISGICMAVKVIEAGIRRIVIIEKSAGFGGTWRDNRYPGCRCDIPGYLYSYSFAGNPAWSRVYPDQREILAYLTTVAAKYDLFRYVRFSSAVESAVWNQADSTWIVGVRILGGKDAEFESFYNIRTDFLVSAVGQLNVPYTPAIPGLDDYNGKVLHSARWSSNANMENLRVGIIGNGATAVQIVPELAKSCSKLAIFQRTPNWVMPRDDKEYAERKKWMLQMIPFARRIYRAALMQRGESFWAPLTQSNSEASEMLHRLCLSHMHSQMPGREDFWERLTPTYEPGCKRILISNDFYPALLRESVEVITSGIKRITKTGVETADGKHSDLDCLILGTGFQTNDFLNSFSVEGLHSQLLHSKWKQEGVQALYGIGVDNMPNFGMLYGPNTNLAHNSIILMIEAQARYIQTLVSKVIDARQSQGRLVIVPKTDRVREYNDQIQKQISLTTFADSKCQSWYKTLDGTVTKNWGRNVIEYQTLLSTVQWSDYELIGPGAEKLRDSVTSIGRIVEEKAMTRPWAIGMVGATFIGLLAASYLDIHTLLARA